MGVLIYNDRERRCMYGLSVCVETSAKSLSRMPLGVTMYGSMGVWVKWVAVDVGVCVDV